MAYPPCPCQIVSVIADKVFFCRMGKSAYTLRLVEHSVSDTLTNKT